MRQLVQKCILWGLAITATYDYLSRVFPYTTFFRVLLRPLIAPGVYVFPHESSCLHPNPDWIFIYFFNIVSHGLLLFLPLWVLSLFQGQKLN